MQVMDCGGLEEDRVYKELSRVQAQHQKEKVIPKVRVALVLSLLPRLNGMRTAQNGAKRFCSCLNLLNEFLSTFGSYPFLMHTKNAFHFTPKVHLSFCAI